MIQTVLFLCTGNYYRSRFAEIVFNHIAAERKLAWRAISRGLDLKIGRNIGEISIHTRDACRARGLALPRPLAFPQALAESDLQQAGIVIAVKEAEHRKYLQRLFPGWTDRVRYWHVHDLDAATPHEALAELGTLVQLLAEELSR